jgi:zinc protease
MNATLPRLAALALLAGASCVRASLPPPAEPLVPTPDAAFRAKPPPQRERPPLVVPEVQRATLTSGATLFVVTRPAQPYVAIRLVSRRGGSDELPSIAGYAALTAYAMLERHRIAEMGADVVEGPESIGFALKTLPDELEPTLAALADVVVRPRFAEVEVSSVRRSYVRTLQTETYSPTLLASHLAARQVLGPDRTMSRYNDELRQAALPFDRQRAIVAHARLFVPNDSAIVLVGPVTLEQATALVEQSFTGWSPSPRPPDPEPPPFQRAARTADVHLVVESVRHAHLAVAVPAPGWLDPDRIAFSVAQTVYAGLLSSRTNLALREGAGHSYGAHGHYTAMRRDGVVVVAAMIDTEDVVGMIRLLAEETRRMQSFAPSADELAAARAVLREGARQDLESGSGLAADIGHLFVYDLPPSSWATYDEAIEAVSVEDIQAAARKYFALASPVVVVTNEHIADAIQRSDLTIEKGRSTSFSKD